MGGWAKKYRRPEQHAWQALGGEARRLSARSGNTGDRDYYSSLLYTETRFLGGNPSQFEPTGAESLTR